MTRLNALILICVAAVFVPATVRADLVTLNPAPTVEDDVVRLGDVFVGTGDKADMAVGYAPALGRRAVFDAVWLTKVARSQGLDWRARSRFDRVIVTRASQILDLRTVSAQISDALREIGVPRLHDVEYDNRALQIHLPARVLPTVAIQDLRYDPVSGRFSTVIAAPADAPTTRTPIAGRIHEVAEVPVAIRRIGKDEVIGPRDLGYERRRVDRLGRDTLLDAESIVGMSPRRGLLPDRPIRVGDILRPVVVAKGSIVTMTLRTPTMLLSARARAIEDGGQDEVIRVTNIASQKTIEVRVTGPDQVVVEPIAFLAARGE
ncbi:MAG: flagellar basal body P-ring formation protein FlgA [Rhodospirillaceae bacterium]|jgi:flagellar basal body P-ring formation protein FlgA|nr:flagellar basal body P-ring formation protein FlgA [Rhodospirillaceae bacterium]MBT6116340.1 flagellar basal body P-ring formation protein FlgA [Rhodospirillaceae bacterium]